MIDKTEAYDATQRYIREGWYDEMIRQLSKFGIPESNLTAGSDQLFNIKFRPEDMDITDYDLIQEEHPIYSVQRYSFIGTEDIIQSLVSESKTPNPFKVRKGEPKDAGRNSEYERQPKMVEVRKRHQTIQRELYKFLSKQYGSNNVTWEFLTENRTQVDLVRKDQDKLIFYEIKTYPSIRVSIREALGQLLEYGHWMQRPEPIEFVIVTDIPINDKVQKYISALIHFYNIPITYAWFDTRKNKLVEYEFAEN